MKENLSQQELLPKASEERIAQAYNNFLEKIKRNERNFFFIFKNFINHIFYFRFISRILCLENLQ